MRGRWAIVLLCLALTGGAGGAAPQPATDELLGFSRYLPPETGQYAALLQAGRVWRALTGSRAVARLLDTPELKTLQLELQRELDPAKLPPEGRQALDLLAAAFDSEVVIALPAESMPRMVGLFKALGLSAALFAPSPFPPESPQGRLLAQKRRPFREAWDRSLEGLQVPPFVLAARVKDGARFSAFVSQMLEQGRSGFITALAGDRSLSPRVRQAMDGAWTVEKVGGVPLHRFRLRAEDLLTEEEVAGALEPAGVPPGDRDRIAGAVRRLTLEVHVGFVGEYLTLAVAPDDRLIRQIVERYEGKPAGTLAASPAFERIRAALTPDAIGISYSDSRRLLGELDDVLDLVRQGLDPQFLALLGAPGELLAGVERLRNKLVVRSELDVARDEGVAILDRGIRILGRLEYVQPPPVGPGPLRSLDFVPADATGYWAAQGVSWDGLWSLVEDYFDQQAAVLAPIKARAAENPELAQAIRRQEAMAKRLLTPIRETLAPGLRGEMGLVLGAAVPLSVPAAPDVEGVRIPTGAMIAHVEDPAKVIDGFRALVRGIAETIVEMQGGDGFAPLPLLLVQREVEGQEVHALVIPGLRIVGFEPHLACVGKGLVLSSSFALTRRIRDAAEGRAPRIASTEAHRTMSAVLDPGAWEVSYLEGGRVQAMLQAVAEGVFTVVERESADRPENLKQVAQARVFVRALLDVAGCFRGHAASRVREGDADVLKEWTHFSDDATK
jgi:hypothetical protein